MWLLNVHTRQLEYFEGRRVPKYAILSHRWEEEEVSFQEWKAISQVADGSTKKGYIKILKCCETVQDYNLDYVWVDTCCINKESSAELSEAINSMYQWYKNAEVCLAYLSDVTMEIESQQPFRSSAWFTRGWTLQELLAPSNLVFYDKDWGKMGMKNHKAIAATINSVTGIPYQAITRFTPRRYSIATRMSWAARRCTTREEDRAYSLLGIFGINMPMLYGEGAAAFQRLQEEIVKVSDDRSIFLWEELPNKDFGAFASAPESFTPPLSLVVKALPTSASAGYTVTNAGITIELYLSPIDSLTSVAYLGSAFVNEFRYLFGIYVIQDQENRESNCYRRIRLGESYVTITPYKSLEPTKLRTINAVLVRQPPEEYIREKSLEFIIKALPFDDLFAGPYSAWDHESGHTRHVIRRAGAENIFLGSVYGLTLSDALTFITVGMDTLGRPICVIDMWPPDLTKEALNSFNLEEDYAASYINIGSLALASQLRDAFDDLHYLGSKHLEPTEGCMITFRGTGDSPRFIYHSTAFDFYRTKSGYELVITQLSAAFKSTENFATWPIEHRFHQHDKLPILTRNYHNNLLGQLRKARDSVSQGTLAIAQGVQSSIPQTITKSLINRKA